ncbi:MFS transporter [Sporolactobacillus sp. CPB3-1]|uniref:MFS transporter n=1 Tax=Sporolactobacillus mangiferae TaxID=2940498 RepID=A0ABT0M856_9BACL|nr:MFS transporter [Sporolactobacillus mangiferae]MCL1630818.1 MFS transporter [Sporolactobacillus mangiferae]
MNLLKQNRNFRLLFSARLITNIGDSVYYVAAMWLVYQLSGSAFYSGIAGFLTMLPRVMQFIVGPIIDRYPIKKLIIVTQLAQAILLVVIPVTAWLNVLNVPLILIVMPVVSFFNQFSFPAESALIPQLLHKEQRIRANSLMTLAYQGTDAVFQAVGGLLIMVAGAVTLYSADVITFFCAILLFSMLRLPAADRPTQQVSFQAQCRRYFSDLGEGIYQVSHSIIGKMIVGSLIINFALGALYAALPAFSDQKGSAALYGFMMAAMAIGTLFGALIAPQFEKKPIGKMLMVGYSVGFLLWMTAALTPNPLLVPLLFLLSMILPGCNNIINFTLIQNIVPHTMLARIMSLVASLATCIMPLGSLIGGVLSVVFGATAVFTAAGFGFLCYAVYVACTPALRHLPSCSKAGAECYDLRPKKTDVHELM